MEIKTIKDVQSHLLPFIPTPTTYRFPASFGMARTKSFLQLLGNPQNKIKTIHIAGTSGKGSTAYFMSLLLVSLGYKTGLHVSPHLIDVRERAQINNTLLSEDKFVRYFNDLIPYINDMEKSEFGTPSVFEILTALAFYIFEKEHVDFAVIETGLGGLYDATNAIDGKNKWVILTKIGLDHMNILGNTISKIALQKAEIIKEGNTVVSIHQYPQAKNVIDEMAKKRQAKLFYIDKKNMHNISASIDKTTFNFSFQKNEFKNLILGTTGIFQAENASVALALLILLSEQKKVTIHKEKIYQALSTAHFAGRFDVKTIKGKIIILDGAHNPQKMMQLVKSLKKVYPGKKFHVLLSFKKGKNYNGILKPLLPVAEYITITNFYTKDENLTNISEDPYVIQKILNKLGYTHKEIIEIAQEALEKALKSKNSHIVITGSLYFLSVIYPLLETIQSAL